MARALKSADPNTYPKAIMLRRVSTPSARLPTQPSHGFTVVEVLIVLSMAVVIVSLAGPPFRNFIIQQNIRNAAYELMSDLIFARSEAVKRNTSVTVSKVGTWSGGWTVAAGATTLRQHPAFPPSITITMPNPSVDFYLNGRASATAGFTLDDAGGQSSIPAQCVSVDPGGRPRSSAGSCP
jgi:type IV fimbrial biogenesis protein FimT